MEAVVAGEVDQRPVVDDVAPGILAQDRGLHVNQRRTGTPAETAPTR
jgi:hypothetical protein